MAQPGAMKAEAGGWKAADALARTSAAPARTPCAPSLSTAACRPGGAPLPACPQVEKVEEERAGKEPERQARIQKLTGKGERDANDRE